MNDNACPGDNCFVNGYLSNGKLRGCSPDCNCARNYASISSYPDQRCGIICQGTCVDAPNPALLPPACGIGSALIPNRCIGGNNIPVARPACPTATNTPANTSTSVPGITSTPVIVATLPPAITSTPTPAPTLTPTVSGPCTLGAPGCFSGACPAAGRACIGTAFDPICECYGGTLTSWKCQGGIVVYTSFADPRAGASCI